MTPDYAIGVWIGYDDNRARWADKQTGGTSATPVFVDIVKGMNLPAKPFPRPAHVVEATIDKATGLLAPEGAPKGTTMHRGVRRGHRADRDRADAGRGHRGQPRSPASTATDGSSRPWRCASVALHGRVRRARSRATTSRGWTAAVRTRARRGGARRMRRSSCRRCRSTVKWRPVKLGVGRSRRAARRADRGGSRR